jgi:hypothetical protein
MNDSLKIITLLFFATLISCAPKEVKNNVLSDEEASAGYKLLFDGTTTAGWHVYNAGAGSSAAWSVIAGELYCDASNGALEHGDLVSDEEFENFDLKFEWKIPVKGNSGVFINVKEDAEIPTAWASGPEYQLLDQQHHDYPIETKRPGCLYGFAPQQNPVEPKPAGEWNESSIKQVNGKIEFYLNGKLTAQQDLNSSQWHTLISQSGFKSFPEFGKHTKGHIALQEWEKGISFRNIRIRKL